jgi:MFS family permease
MNSTSTQRWYQGITTYQWLVLLIASLGWVFDVFEGQVFVASMDELAKDLLGESTTEGERAYYNNISLGLFLLGGALGGVTFGVVSDRIGRARTMILTILMYSAFTCLTAFAQEWWQVAVLRFLVAMGVGGEWAVASSMVAEHFPARARAWSGAIFHSSSVFGTFLATLAGAFIVDNPSLGWRWAFGIGVVPALLTLWIRWQLHDSPASPRTVAVALRRDEAVASTESGSGRPSRGLSDLFAGEHLRHVVLGVSLATVGLATFWGVHIYGKDALRNADLRALISAGENTDTAAAKSRLKQTQMTGMLLTTIGGGAGLLAFGPLCAWLGRRAAFALFHVGGFSLGVLLFGGLPNASYSTTACILPVFGFMTLGMHAGYAIYFPELFPSYIRGAGAGFCFNVGRVLAAPVLFGNGLVQKAYKITLYQAATALSVLFLLGLILLLFAPETKGKELD